MWIYEHTNWPNFTWDNDTLTYKLADVRHSQGMLLGRMKNLGFDLRLEANLNTLTKDVVKSSAIEGENLNPEQVRSSIARRLGVDIAGLVPTGRDVEGIVEIMLDATRQFAKPLTKRRLFDWHAALFPTGRSGMHKITVGAWRTEKAEPMQVVSGAIGHEKIHFQAPPADRVNRDMQDFIKWLKHDTITDAVLKAGLAHFWFVTIHPFEDGNGRIARAIADMVLARADKNPDRFYSLSTQIESERKEYYKQLENQQRGSLDITGWMRWFLDCLKRAITNAEDELNVVLFKAQLWEKINQQPVNMRQRSVINRMLEYDFQGYINTSKYAKLAKCSPDTALRDIQDLKGRGIFIQNPGGGRSTSYRLPDISME